MLKNATRLEGEWRCKNLKVLWQAKSGEFPACNGLTTQQRLPQMLRGDQNDNKKEKLGHYHILWLSPPVVSGDPSKEGQDGFPINNVGNGREGMDFR